MKKVLIIFIFFFTTLWVPLGVLAQSDSGQTIISVIVSSEVSCNSNDICESILGENELNCFNDCGCNNNGVCQSERGESVSNCPNDCAISGGGGGGGAAQPEFYIKNLEISKITFDSAEISWQTNKSASCSIYLGKTPSYEKETISETRPSLNHSSQLADLSPITVYHFNIACKNIDNLTTETGDRYFTTFYVIGNVNNFTATAREKEIFLSWENPADPNFQSVRLLKNEKFYPANINDGQILYEGKGESFIDRNVEAKKGYYYAIFAKGKNGSWSSGALALTQIQPAPITPASPQLKKLKLSDFDFYSATRKIPVINEKTVEPEANKSLIVSIDYEKVPKDYKEMFFELSAGKNKFYYLFQLNKEKTVYSVRLVSPLDPKTYPLTITFFDQNNKLLYGINGEISVKKIHPPAILSNILLILIIMLILLILIFLLIRRKRK